MNLNFFASFILIYHQRLLSLAGFFIFCGLLAGLYLLITWKMKPKFRSVFNKFLAILIFLAGIVFVFDMTTSLITIFQINRQLGFTYATPETKDGEIFELQIIRKDKTMDMAGFKPLDRLSMNNVNDFYRLLIANQGNTVIISVLRENKVIEIELNVPQMKLPLKHVAFLTF